MISPRAPRGYLMLLAIVFGAIFLTVLGALSGYVLTESKIQTNATANARALAIAEAGVEYYRWFLAHYPTDLTNGTGQPGPYTIPYADPEGGQAGTFELSVAGNSSCGAITSIDITSTGRPEEDPTISKTITARYAQPTVARFSYILNSAVWAGPDRVILGPYHSNGGIRMDGTGNSPVTSSVETWSCGSGFGCSPTQNRPGVFGAGANQGLWEYPVPQVDFAGIAADFSSLKTKAIANGTYYSRFSSSNNKFHQNYWDGYRLTFNGNGTVTVRRVTNTVSLPSTQINAAENGEELPDRTLIASESFLTTLTLPSNCGLIFVEDHVWIDGVVDRKVTVVAANITTTGVAPNVMLPGNITYAATDGSDGLTVIAENNVLITPNSPYNMTLNGIFVAQGGAFGRNFYWRNSTGPGSGCSTVYEPRGQLTILGTTVSNLRTGTQWIGPNCGSGQGAGYDVRIDAFDRKLSTDPPPFTPQTSSDFEFVEWREQ
ncbi:MAG TPA: hypothetical protein PK609_01445 [Candidatus Paceibacterota bacterium]|nr:hypothetical protein [Candidatus Paceibacterota bacterium]